MNELFLKIINMSISASWLILAVLILRLVLKKAPKWVNVLLWGIVAVRLICPLSFESALSLIPSSETIPLDIEMAAKPTIDSGVPAINSVVNPVLSSFAPPQHVLTSANPLQIWIPILNIIWLIGVGALLLYTAVSYWRLCRKVDTAVRYKGNIFQSENVSSPFVLGIIKPRIYLPFNMNGQDLEHVVAHEQAHIRRKDHWWKPLGFLLLTIHWFNPLMWLAYVLLCRDIEFACDEKVIKELGNEQRAGVKNTKKSDEYGGFTPGYQISALLEDGTYIRINGYSLSDNDMVDIEWNGERYVVSDGEFQDYLSRICVGGDVAVAEPVPSVTKWFDYLETPDEMQWGGRHEINLPEFPDVTFRWTYGEMMAVTGNEITSLYTGMPIWNAYFCDLTGDGLPELCSTISWGSGMIDNRVTIYDYANGASYELSDRGYFDFTLRFNEADGYLYVDKKKYNTDELVETGRLVFKNNCIQIEGFSNEAHQVFQAEILEDHNGYYLVKPVEGSWELNSADRIEVPIRNAHPSPEPEIGDVIEIEYSGEILETYPARIADVYGIKVIKQTETWDLIPMVMVNGTLYLDTGHESKIEARCGVMDGEITSQVDGNKQPSVDNQSNFGTGYGYQYGATEGTIELFMNGKWWIFATEEARQKIQFPSIEDEISKFYLTIGSEGVKSIKLSMSNSSGGFENADGSLLKKGERIWLENLDGYTDLRGLTITALGENGEIIWTASIPDEEENKGFTHLVNDDWEITNIE